MHWTDERLDEKMASIDQTFERFDARFDRVEAELRGLRSDFAALQDRLIQIGFGLAGILVVQMIAVIIALTR
jgi:hypothetical protein